MYRGTHAHVLNECLYLCHIFGFVGLYPAADVDTPWSDAGNCLRHILWCQAPGEYDRAILYHGARKIPIVCRACSAPGARRCIEQNAPRRLLIGFDQAVVLIISELKRLNDGALDELAEVWWFIAMQLYKVSPDLFNNLVDKVSFLIDEDTNKIRCSLFISR